MICLYATKAGTTRRLAHRVATLFGEFPVRNVTEIERAEDLAGVGALIMLCPTYGDSELEESFELFLTRVEWPRLEGVSYAFCEVGIYTGYEDFGHGIAPIVDKVLGSAGLVQVAPALALDAVPVTEWALVESWVKAIQHRLATSV